MSKYVIRNNKILTDDLGKKIVLPKYEQKDEIRAIWISTVANIDLPLLTTTEQYKEEIIKRLDHLQRLNFNTIFFQVRPLNDAFYPSELAPWSRYITGKENKDPGFDVLGFVLNEAHKRNFELHAWLNPYRIANSEEVFEKLSNKNFAKKRPDLVINSLENINGKINKRYILNPGEPEVQQYILDVIKELLNNYPDLDGIHFDDYFYLNKRLMGIDENALDYQTFVKYKNDITDIESFRRQSVNIVIKGTYDLVNNHNLKHNKNAKFGVSPTGIWRNGIEVGGSKTKGQEHYVDLAADSKYWVEQNWLHYILPQVYWPFDKFNNLGEPVAPFANIVNWWSNISTNTQVDLIIGIGLYRQDEKEAAHDWFYPNELIEQIKYIQKIPNVIGCSIFTYKTLNNENENIQKAIETLNTKYWTKQVKHPW